MYSVVLMMAMTGGAETPDFGRRGGCSGGGYGCSGGGYGCSGGYGGGYGCSGGGYGCSGGGYGCSGSGRRGLFGGGHGHRRGHGCSGGCSGGYVGCSGGYGGGYGCSGGYGGGYGCSGMGGYGGGYGCTGGMGGYGGYGCSGGFGGGYGCAGGVYGPPITGGTTGKGEKIPPPVKSQLQAPATILVSLPAEAKLLVDGATTISTSTERRLVSPALQTGREYHYTLTAEVVRNGQTVREERPVTVRAGEETRVQFTFTEAAVTASR